MALEDIGILAQDTDPGVTTLVDACNGFNKLSSLAILWMVHHCWPEEASFAFNCYRHWEHVLLRQPGDTPVVLLSQEGVTPF